MSPPDYSDLSTVVFRDNLRASFILMGVPLANSPAAPPARVAESPTLFGGPTAPATARLKVAAARLPAGPG